MGAYVTALEAQYHWHQQYELQEQELHLQQQRVQEKQGETPDSAAPATLSQWPLPSAWEDISDKVVRIN